ncbi:MAG: hypothetical protein V1918_02425 [Planctomycetota bacterium]
MAGSRRALLAGHCGPDSARIEAALSGLAISVDRASSVPKALRLCEGASCALVIGNREIGPDKEGGLRLVRAVQASRSAAATPMLIPSAFAETEEAVRAAGGEAGFGKDLLEREGRARFAPYFPKDRYS